MVKETTPAELYERIENGEDVQVVDIRPADEFAQGHIPGAENVPFDRFADEGTAAALRTVRQRTRSGAYDRLRDAAAARSELTDEEREAIASGELAAELEAARTELERLNSALEAHEAP